MLGVIPLLGRAGVAKVLTLQTKMKVASSKGTMPSSVRLADCLNAG